MGVEDFNSFKPDKRNQRAVDEEKERLSRAFHNENLHDETPASGELLGPDGKLIDPSPAVSGADEELTEMEMRKEDPSEDIMGSLPQEEDAAAKWLREHDNGDDLKKAA
jgi:hypothetical protein